MTPCVKEPPWYTLERDGEVVAEYDAKGVSGWCMEEVDG